MFVEVCDNEIIKRVWGFLLLKDIFKKYKYLKCIYVFLIVYVDIYWNIIFIDVCIKNYFFSVFLVLFINVV